MKKILIIMVTLGMFFSFAGCANNRDQNNNNQDDVIPTLDASPEVDDDFDLDDGLDDDLDDGLDDGLDDDLDDQGENGTTDVLPGSPTPT